MFTKITLALLTCVAALSAQANINQWTGFYRGVGVVEKNDGKRHEIRCELQISADNDKTSPEMIQISYSEDGQASIHIQNLGNIPKHMSVKLTDNQLGIPPLFAHPVSIKLQKEAGGFNEKLIVGDLIEYDVSYAQEPKVINTLHLKLGKLQ
jgi:hypothetical protein